MEFVQRHVSGAGASRRATLSASDVSCRKDALSNPTGAIKLQSVLENN